MDMSDVICTLPAKHQPANRDDVDAAGIYLGAAFGLLMWAPILWAIFA